MPLAPNLASNKEQGNRSEAAVYAKGQSTKSTTVRVNTEESSLMAILTPNGNSNSAFTPRQRSGKTKEKPSVSTPAEPPVPPPPPVEDGGKRTGRRLLMPTDRHQNDQ